MNAPIITMLTDFGLIDPWVGVMKGVILGICPHCRLIDLTHFVPPQDVAGGALQLERAVQHFPPGTIHLAVVDPGVGSSRRAVALVTDEATFVGPDNGLLSRVAPPDRIRQVVVLDVPDQASRTFHGRDVFAPAAARLAAGAPLASLGQPWSGPLVQLPIPERTVRHGGLPAAVMWVDYFGNLLTDLHRDHCPGNPGFVEVAGQKIGFHRTFADVPLGQLLALFGSDGYLEIARNGGNAASYLGITVGASARVVFG